MSLIKMSTITRRAALFAGLGCIGLGQATALATTWPAARGDGEEIVRLYGERGRFVGRMLHVGDPLADAVVAELPGLGEDGHRLLQRGIAYGLASLTDPPPAIAAFLRSAETVPPWVTPRTFTGGSRTFMSIPLPAHAVTLSLAALTHTYSSPAIAGVLVGTGELINSTKRRLVETTDWLLRCMQPGALRRGGKGYVATLQVRMLHAQARARTLARGWNVGALGHPLGQVDLARTWLDFLPISYAALGKLGYDCTADEVADLYRTWWYIGHLLGIDPGFYLGITDHQAARRLLALVDATNRAPDANSKALVTQTVAGAADLFSLNGILPTVSRETIRASFRHVNGDRIADFFGVPASPAQALLPLAALAAGEEHQLARSFPPAWEARIKANEALAETFLALLPTSAYVTNSGGYHDAGVMTGTAPTAGSSQR
ncbi:oxygenase MpaB family protein [Nonomuraea sp. NPDC050556]|uniref:oxygenase MpaB family protein n=1 Tax=Nonomuraea sp. NPDC050556 TaxID=3364369 RepID=UPI0037967A4E